ncbi:acyltransferase family protein [Microbacterium sp. NPDC057407]|uniref:acyltransferase family protein n=1 Tax=Microbacterium sp. NPDC057407 TaxID=3346120 RepID=UPI0036728656
MWYASRPDRATRPVPPAGPDRDAVLDVAKGIAIVAVVFVHVWRGVDAAGLLADPALFRLVDTTVCLWVLTVFAFVAGLFIERGMKRDGAGRYVGRRVLDFAWLYVVWSILNNLANLVGSQLANTPITLEQTMRLWEPRAQMWYLGWIALMVVIAAVSRPWESRTRLVVTLATVGAASAATWGLNGSVVGTLGLGISLAFFAGVAVRADRAVALLAAGPAWVHAFLASAAMCATVALVAMGLAGPPTHDGEHRTATTVVIGMAASSLATIAVLQVSRLLSATSLRRPLTALGQASMVIFLAHLLFTPTTRIALSGVGVADPTAQVVVGVALGVAGPLALRAVATRSGAPWLFSAPRVGTGFRSWAGRRP